MLSPLSKCEYNSIIPEETILEGEDIHMEKIYFAQIRENAIIPSKIEENVAFDIYANFKEESMFIEPHTVKMIPTGIASAFSNKYGFIIKERGSTGIKNLKINAGVIDSGFRNEWMILIYNGNDCTVEITKNMTTGSHMYSKPSIKYPYEKAIAQAMLVEVPKVEVETISYEELLKMESVRGLGMMGSSLK